MGEYNNRVFWPTRLSMAISAFSRDSREVLQFTGKQFTENHAGKCSELLETTIKGPKLEWAFPMFCGGHWQISTKCNDSHLFQATEFPLFCTYLPYLLIISCILWWLLLFPRVLTIDWCKQICIFLRNFLLSFDNPQHFVGVNRILFFMRIR